MTEFDDDTLVTADEGGYRAEVSARWNVGDKPNGGYLMALVARAAVAEGLQPDPLTVTTHFLRPPAPGPVSIQVETVRAGRAHATFEVRLRQDGVECLRALAACGTLGRAGGPSITAADPPDLPPLEDAVRATADLPDGTHVAIMDRFDVRFDPRTIGWAAGRPSGRPEVGAWVRLADGREPDLPALLAVVDALPPTVFSLGLAGWVPTLELTTHLRAHPAPGWLRVWVRTRLVLGGYLEEDAEVWDSTDTLVAMSRQLALVPAT